MLTRRNSFPLSPEAVDQAQARQRIASGRMAGETKRPQVAPTVSRDVAEIATHLAQNPVFVDVFSELRRAAMDRLTNSPLGPEGATEREAGRYELNALDVIENRIASLASEISLYPASDDTLAD